MLGGHAVEPYEGGLNAANDFLLLGERRKRDIYSPDIVKA